MIYGYAKPLEFSVDVDEDLRHKSVVVPNLSEAPDVAPVTEMLWLRRRCCARWTSTALVVYRLTFLIWMPFRRITSAS